MAVLVITNALSCCSGSINSTNVKAVLKSHLSLETQLFPSDNTTNKLFPSDANNNITYKLRRISKRSFSPIIVSAQPNWLRVLQTTLKVGKDGIEAGTNLVPDAVPRPIARAVVAVVAGTVALFVLKSFLSTAFFVLAMMGFIYFVYIAFNKDEGPKGGGGTGVSDEETLEEARRIMEKYK